MFNSLFPKTIWVCQHRKGKAELFWMLMKQQMIGWQWHQLDHMQYVNHSNQITTRVHHHLITQF